MFDASHIARCEGVHLTTFVFCRFSRDVLVRGANLFEVAKSRLRAGKSKQAAFPVCRRGRRLGLGGRGESLGEELGRGGGLLGEEVGRPSVHSRVGEQRDPADGELGSTKPRRRCLETCITPWTTDSGPGFGFDPAKNGGSTCCNILRNLIGRHHSNDSFIQFVDAKNNNDIMMQVALCSL